MGVPMEPRELRGDLVILEPLKPSHRDELIDAVRDGDLHELWYTNVPSPDGMEAEIQRRLALQESGGMLPFTIRRCSDGVAMGMTTFTNIDRNLPRVEIGSTWLRSSASGTGINADAKLLMLTQAFDEWDCPAVEFRTHALNHQSRAAIERLGASLDGILRSHTRTRNGALRNSCVYSVTAPEWAAVRAGLEARINRRLATGK